jgi:predicted nucleic acid-binding protein
MDIEKVLSDASRNNDLYINTEDTIINACQIAQRYGFSFYDSVIISAALECDCKVLYSEDMNIGQVIAKKLKIVNPFT